MISCSFLSKYTNHLINSSIQLEKLEEQKEDSKTLYIKTHENKDSNGLLDNVRDGTLNWYIQHTEEAYVSCPDNPLPFQYCQNHYLVCWDSNSRNYSLYNKTAFTEDRVDFTITFHTSVNRLSYLSELRKRWNGPISLSIFMRFSQIDQVEHLLLNSQQANLRVVLYVIKDSATDCIYRSQWNETTHSNQTICIPANDTIYPINTLRNLAIQNIQTSHFLNMDMDMWPSYGLYEQLLKIQVEQLEDPREALVLPAFQFTLTEREVCKEVEDCLSELKPKLPANKTQLLSCIREGVCQIANARLPTHRFVSDEWWTTIEAIQVLDCLPFKIMEPYLLLRRTKKTPLYDENFINYGYNKVQYIDHLHHLGYHFNVLTIGFGFDVPHKPSLYATKYEESWKVKNVVNADVYQDFLQRLENVVPDYQNNKQQICDREDALKKYRTNF